MRALKLTILVEDNIQSLADVFGNFILLGRKYRFIQFTFKSISMLSTNHLAPVYNLIKSYEQDKILRYKMFYLYDELNDSFSPISIHCNNGKWFTVNASTGVEMNYSDTLSGLF